MRAFEFFFVKMQFFWGEKFDSLVKYRKYDEEKATKKLLRPLRQSASEYVGTSDGLIVSDV